MATTLQVILNSDVPNLGSSGELVKVRPGFARNYLLPRKLAVPATTAQVNRLNHEKAVAVAKAEKNKKAMQELATKLSGIKITLARPVGEDDKLYMVSVGGATCSTPCVLQVKPGPQQLMASFGEGDGFSSLLMVPEGGGAYRVAKGRRPYTGAGVALTVVGAVVASSFWAFGLACGRSSECFVGNVVFWPLTGAGMFFTGIGLLGYGATHSTPSGAKLMLSSSRYQAESAVRLTSLGVQPAQVGSGATAGLGFDF